MGRELLRLMRVRGSAENTLRAIDQEILETLKPILLKEIQQRQELWESEISDLAASLPAPRTVIHEALNWLVKTGQLELGNVSGRDIWTLKEVRTA